MIKDVLFQNLFQKYETMAKNIPDSITEVQIQSYGFYFATSILLHNRILNNYKRSLIENGSFSAFQGFEKFMKERNMKVDEWEISTTGATINYFDQRKKQINKFLVTYCAFLYTFLSRNRQQFRATSLYEPSCFHKKDEEDYFMGGPGDNTNL